MIKLKKLLTITLLFVGAGVVTGCGTPKDTLTLAVNQEGEGIYEGVLVRGFIQSSPREPEHFETTNDTLDALFDDVNIDRSVYGAFNAGIYMTDRRFTPSSPYTQWPQIGEISPALGAQAGDLVDYLSAKSTFIITEPYLIGVRVVCKFYDEECISRERRDGYCEDGITVINDEPHPDKPCGGWGSNSEKFAAILGPLEELYGSLENYLRAHNAPYDACLITDLSCGSEEGKAIKRGEFEKFAERFPNHKAAAEVADDFLYGDAYEEGDTGYRRWAIYLSEHMWDSEPVKLTQEDFGVTRDRSVCSGMESNLCAVIGAFRF